MKQEFLQWVGEALASLFQATEVAPTPLTEGLREKK